MDIDFREQYKNFLTCDLLKITMSPGSYQSAAVIAAAEVLNGRVITQADRDEAEKKIGNSETAYQKKKLPVISIRDINSMPDKWVNVILAIAVLQYLYLLYIDINALDVVLHRQNFPFRLVLLGSYIDLLYLPILLFMFYRHNRWGWILLLGAKLFTIIPTLVYYFHDYGGGSIFPFFLFETFLNVAVVMLLWKQDVRRVFTVNNRTGLFTVLATALLLLIWLFRF